MLDAGVVLLSFHVESYRMSWSLLLLIDIIQSYNWVGVCSNTQNPT